MKFSNNICIETEAIFMLYGKSWALYIYINNISIFLPFKGTSEDLSEVIVDITFTFVNAFSSLLQDLWTNFASLILLKHFLGIVLNNVSIRFRTSVGHISEINWILFLSTFLFIYTIYYI